MTNVIQSSWIIEIISILYPCLNREKELDSKQRGYDRSNECLQWAITYTILHLMIIDSQMCSVKFNFILQTILKAKCILTEPWLKVGSVLKCHFGSGFWLLQHRLCWTSLFTDWAAALHQLPMNTPGSRGVIRIAVCDWRRLSEPRLDAVHWLSSFVPPPSVLRPPCQKKLSAFGIKVNRKRFFLMNSETYDWFCRAPLRHYCDVCVCDVWDFIKLINY